MTTILKANNIADDYQEFKLPIDQSVENLDEAAGLNESAVESLQAKDAVSFEKEELENENNAIDLAKGANAAHFSEEGDVSHESVPYSQAELDAIKEDAYSKGYQEGLKDVEGKYQSLFDKAELTLASLNNAIPNHVKEHESVIGSIVIEAVFKIVGPILSNKSQSLAVVNDIIESLDAPLIERVYISQSDFNALTELQDNIKGESQLSSIRSLPDDLFEVADITGGCKVVLRDGFLDASLDKQIAVLIESLKNKVIQLGHE